MTLNHLQLSLKSTRIESEDLKHQRGRKSELSEGGFTFSCCCCNTEDKYKSGGMAERGVQPCLGGFDSKIERKGFLSSVKVSTHLAL